MPMDFIHNTVNKTLEDVPENILSDLLDEKLRAQGINLTKDKLKELANRVLKEKVSEFSLDVDTDLKEIAIKLTDADMKIVLAKMEAFLASMPALIQGMLDDTAQAWLESLKRRWMAESERQHNQLDEFRERLADRWGDGLELLKMLVTISRDYGSALNEELRSQGGGAKPITFDVLIKLHARSCQVFEEIVCLLSNGFADGAMARWRTLHEIAAVAFLVHRHGDDLAERYLCHEAVEARKAAIQYQRHHKDLGYEPFDQDELDGIEKRYAELIAKYGKPFRNSQGWAAKHLGKDDPSFADIQEAASIDHLAPFYKMASHNVHANPKGVLFKLGLAGQSNILLAGPSNAGLTDPGHAAALSLVQISSSLLSLNSTADYIVTMKMMQILADEIGDALIVAHRELEEEERPPSA
ncbi:hypothetical protein JQ607_09830 [Bradyrhizobium liaoningense]|uniref:DUF5677 domain-containing protein n=1 Tax=Bradyrhizobium liaoningense TaxID=43992 RepID=UPI001BAA4455|nr:DUF5677 domain-containing protein [Bradyrhizobium liaoningense]MBR0840485.1 hypothetical protein [Bradyrhizobium liaoningense]